jgi:hypothetical protein
MDQLVGGRRVQRHNLVQSIGVLLGKCPGQRATPVVAYERKSSRPREMAREGIDLLG